MEKPKNLKEAINYINPMFDGMEKYFEANLENPVKTIVIPVYDEYSFATFCHSQTSGGIGMKIRNHLGFWGNQNTELFNDLKLNHYCNDPHAMSNKIIREIYILRKLKEQVYETK